MNETDIIWQLQDTLGGDNGRVVQFLAWIGAARVPLKLVSAWIQRKASEAVAKVVASSDTEDDHVLMHVLSSKTYRTIAFLLDWIFSIKLPSIADVKPILEKKST